MDWLLDRIVVGIRYKRTFRIIDRKGEIVDSLISLQDEESFPLECFKKYAFSNDRSSFLLHDEDKSMVLECTKDTTIFNYKVDLVEPIETEIIKEIFNKSIERIFTLLNMKKVVNRVGVIYEYVFTDKKSPGEELLSKITKLHLKGMPESFYLKVNVKEKEDQSLIKSNRNNFKNMILQLSTEENDDSEDEDLNKIRLSLDHQIYFDPEISFSNAIINNQFNEAINYLDELKKDNLKMLNVKGS